MFKSWLLTSLILIMLAPLASACPPNGGYFGGHNNQGYYRNNDSYRNQWGSNFFMNAYPPQAYYAQPRYYAVPAYSRPFHPQRWGHRRTSGLGINIRL